MCPPLSALPLSFASRFGFPPSLRSPPFPFALPCFAPTAVPQVLPSSLGSYSLSFRLRPCVRSLRFHPAFAVLPLRSRPFRIFATRSLFLPFPSSTFRLTGAFRAPSALPSASQLRSSLRFSSFAPFPAVHFRFLWFPSLRARYSVPPLFLSPLCGLPHGGSPHRLPSLSGSGLPLSFFLPSSPFPFVSSGSLPALPLPSSALGSGYWA